METVRAVFEDGVFRPVVPVMLPEHAEFDFEPRPVATIANGAAPAATFGTEEGLRKVYAILSERFDSGHTDTAARHNEHQP
jgi:hypothetical protein